jgi:SulP family sulfate permease
MGQLTHGKIFAQGARHHDLNEPVPPGIVVYDIDGTLFFGAARLAAETVLAIENDVEVFVFAMDDVLFIDYSGCLHLKAMLDEIAGKKNVVVVFAGLREEAKQVLEKAGLMGSNVKLAPTLSQAMRIARECFPAII